MNLPIWFGDKENGIEIAYDHARQIIDFTEWWDLDVAQTTPISLSVFFSRLGISESDCAETFGKAMK